MRLLLRFRFFWIIALPLLISGCSEELPDAGYPQITVQGQVLRPSKAITSGWVEFVPVDGGKGFYRSGEIQPGGEFKVTGLGPGLHGVRVIVPRDQSLFPFDKFFSPIRRVLTDEPLQTITINLDEESRQLK